MQQKHMNEICRSFICLFVIYFILTSAEMSKSRGSSGNADKRNRQLPGQCDRTVSKVSLGPFALDETRSLASSRSYAALMCWWGGCLRLAQWNLLGWHG